VDRCSEILRPHLGFHLETLLYPGEDNPADLEEKLRQTANAQPALFVIEYALASLWMELGIRPQAMLGHSLGEYVAACLAGVMSLEDALRLVTVRGQLMQNMPPGAMLTVTAPHLQVTELLKNHKDLALAAVNGESLCVVSGPQEAIVRLETQLTEQGLGSQRLRTSHAFHSPMMAPVAESLRRVLTEIKLKSPCIPFLSNLTGGWITPEEATSTEYWVQHLLHTVRFSDNLSQLLREPGATLLEMGPATLTVLAKRHPERRAETRLLASIKSRAEKTSEYLSFLQSVGILWADGRQILWHILPRQGKCKRVILPTYPFERQRYNIPVAAQPIAQMFNGTVENPPGPILRVNLEQASITICEPQSQWDSNGKQPGEQASRNQAAGMTASSASVLSAQQLVLRQLEVVARQLELLRQHVQ
jgi:acyl transferase domain-containing protein